MRGLRASRGRAVLAAVCGACAALAVVLSKAPSVSSGRAAPSALEEETPEEAFERQMNTTASMFKEWGVVRDVRVLPNPDYMRPDDTLPRALQGTSVDEVAQRAVMSAIADMEQQQAEEDEAWAQPSDELIASIVPAARTDVGADAENEEDGDDEEERIRADNLKRIRWMKNARRAAQRVAVSATAIDRANIRDWEDLHPRVFPEDIVFPLDEYPDGRPVLQEVEVDDEDEDE